MVLELDSKRAILNNLYLIIYILETKSLDISAAPILTI